MIAPADYEFFRRLLKGRSGLALPDDKQYLLESRLTPVMDQFGIQGFAQLAQRLRGPDAREIEDAVVDAMTTNETFFFRDRTPFETFTSFVLPSIARSRPAGQPLRIWCAAASTGQEPYSLAMCLRENAAIVGGRKVEILATDISHVALDRAKAGIYSQFEVQRGLPIQHLLKYFTKSGDQWQVNADIRAMITYRYLNLLDSFISLGRFDIVFCRNVLIYFDPPTKSDVLERISKLMAPDGHLFLGGAETVVGLTDCLRPNGDYRGLYHLKGSTEGADVPTYRIAAPPPSPVPAAPPTTSFPPPQPHPARPGDAQAQRTHRPPRYFPPRGANEFGG